MRKPGRNGIVIALSVLAVVAASVWRMSDAGAESVGEPVDDVSVQMLDGGIVSLSDLRGQVVLVNFWATWCPPCRVEMPGFQRVWEARRDDGFVIVGLSTDRLPTEQIEWFLEQRGFDYPVARATQYAASAFGYGGTLPHSFLLDAEGRVRREVTGAYDERELVRDVDGLLVEAGLEPTGEVAEARLHTPTWMELEGVGHRTGSAEAPITVVEFSDYGCTYCSRFTQEAYPALRSEFIEEGTVRWVHVPFVLGKFPNSQEAAVAAVCAGEQSDEVYQSVHQTLFRRQAEWRQAADAAPVFERYVTRAGGDGAEFASCYASDEARETLAKAEQTAMAAGVAVTPTFFVNGQRVEGAAPLSEFQRVFRAMATGQP